MPLLNCRDIGRFSLVFLFVLLLGIPAGNLRAEDKKKDAPKAQTPAQSAATKPALPTEYAFTLSKPYGEADRFTTDPKAFENLLINMKKSGFNCIHCPYRDWRLELCRKHDVKMMLDLLAWKGDINTDFRRPEQRVNLKPIMEKLRGDKAVWGYNIWNEKLSWFGCTDGKNIDECITMLKEWDPTHPIWMGTYQVIYANAPKAKPGVHAYYDYPWERGFVWHFAGLNWYRNYVPTQDGVFGSWQLVSNYNRNSYSVNTSIAFGQKVVLWFIDGPFDEQGNVNPKDRSFHYVKIGQEMHKLYPEIGKIGRPNQVYSTQTTKWQDGKDKPKDIPWRLEAFPADFWFQVRGGEAVVGFFKYPDGADAVWIANHNAYGPQQMSFTVAGDDGAKVELFDRENGGWKELAKKDGAYGFDLRTAGGDLVRVTGRKSK
ncbi:MAG: hypothetical protein K8T91_17300 [Planctomycetes bacterium]|nr:hypothetical protein [Planctomycetota bacterium]